MSRTRGATSLPKFDVLAMEVRRFWVSLWSLRGGHSVHAYLTPDCRIATSGRDDELIGTYDAATPLVQLVEDVDAMMDELETA